MAMQRTSVKYDVIAQDHASKTFEQVGGAAEGLSAKMAGAAAAIGLSFVGVGAAISASITEAFDQADISSNLQAQLGTSNKVAAAQGKIAGKLYSSGVSDSFQEAADSIKAVAQSGLVPPDATNKQLQSIATKASDVAKVFGQDLGGVTNAVSQMMRTGLAKSADQAFDILTKGFQAGNDKAGDLLDTMNEYGVQFKKAGVSGEQAMGLISQAIKAGARDSDLAADAIKEFTIRAVDGSTTTAQGFQMLGLNADDMARKFSKGGSSANAVLDITLDRLRGMKDHTKQAQAATKLFGTQAEDLGSALVAMDPSKATDKLGKFTGATDKLGKTIRSGPRYQIQTFKRTVQQDLVNFTGGVAIPAALKFGRTMGSLIPIDKLKRAFKEAKTIVGDFFDGLSGKSDVSKALPRIDRAPEILPPSASKQFGEQIRSAISGGIGDIDWGKLSGKIGEGLGKALEWVGKHASDLAKKLSEALSKIDFVEVGKAVGGAAIPFAVGFIRNLFEPLFTAEFWRKHWGDVLLAAVSFIPFGKLGGVLGKIGGKVLEGIGSLLKKIPWQKIIPFAGKLTESVGPTIAAVGRWVARVARGFGEAFARRFPRVAQWFHDQLILLPVRLGDLGRLLKRKAGELVGKLGGWLTGHIPGMGNKFIRAMLKAFGRFSLWLTGVNLAKSMLSGIGNALQNVGSWLKRHLVDPVVGWVKRLFGIHSPSKVFSAIGGALVAGLKAGVRGAAKAIGSWAWRTIGKPVVGAFRGAGSWLSSKGGSLVRGFKSGAVSAAKGIGGWAWRAIGSPVVGTFGRAGSWLYTKGKALISGLKSGIGSAIKGIGSWLKSHLIDPIVRAVKHFFGIHSPSTVFAGIGGHLVSGLIKGLAVHSGTSIARKIFGDLPSALGAIVSKGLVSISGLPGKALKALGGLGGQFLDLLGLGGGGGGGGSSSNKRLGKTMAAAYGWGGPQWTALQALWMGESGWNHKALNRSSGAYGIPQALPATKMSSAGADWRTNPATQIKWGLNYIKSRYGNPVNAYSQWLGRSPHWYGHGGRFQAGQMIGVGDRGRELLMFDQPGRVFSPEETKRLLAAADTPSGGDTYHNTYHLYQRDMTLRDLNTLQRSQEARARVGRPR